MHSTARLVQRAALAVLVGGSALVGTGLVSAQQMLPLDAIKESGQGVSAAYEGWFVTPEGKKALLIGFWNRNTKQILDIPVGPNNRVEPGGPDMGQPTHFDPRRGWGTFSIVLPDDFGDKKLTWTIVANGKTEAIPMGLHPDYVVEPYKETGMGNTPPVLKFSPTGKTFTGPPLGIAHELQGTAGQPVTLNIWATDDGVEDPRFPGRGNKPLNVRWIVHRQPVGADVKFATDRPKVDKEKGGDATTTATFSVPGDYVLRAQGTDLSGEGGGGFQCCWTSAHVKVTIK